MAITTKGIRDKFSEELTEVEQSIVEAVERYVDSEITQLFNGSSFTLDSEIFNFNRQVTGDKFLDLKMNQLTLMQKKKMSTELKRRYNNAGWMVIQNLSTVNFTT